MPSSLLEEWSLGERLGSLGRTPTEEVVDYEYGLWRELSELKHNLQQQPDMEGHWSVLREKGAVFYHDPAECPEVKMLGLREYNEI